MFSVFPIEPRDINHWIQTPIANVENFTASSGNVQRQFSLTNCRVVDVEKKNSEHFSE